MAIAKIKIGDMVQVIAGGCAGQKGPVKKIDGDRITISGVNFKVKAVKPNPEMQEEGGHKHIEHPVHRSNVALFDSESQSIMRVRIEQDEAGNRYRVNKKTGERIDKQAVS